MKDETSWLLLLVIMASIALLIRACSASPVINEDGVDYRLCMNHDQFQSGNAYLAHVNTCRRRLRTCGDVAVCMP